MQSQLTPDELPYTQFSEGRSHHPLILKTPLHHIGTKENIKATSGPHVPPILPT